MSEAEVWLRGPLPGYIDELQPVAHSLLQVSEELGRLGTGGTRSPAVQGAGFALSHGRTRATPFGATHHQGPGRRTNRIGYPNVATTLAPRSVSSPGMGGCRALAIAGRVRIRAKRR